MFGLVSGQKNITNHLYFLLRKESIEIYKNGIKITVLLIFIFSANISALAATSNVDEQDSIKLIEQRESQFPPFKAEANNAIYRLKNLGIMEGYPDGTFGENKTITRAEFAKLAVITAGLGKTAVNEQGNSSVFSDVNSDFWANGWINVAVAQQFLKGDGNDKFRPEDIITQAEAITVLLRILGYNDNLPGIWPANYVAKAAQLGGLDNLMFLAYSPTTRAEAAVMISESLDQVMVEYNSADSSFRNIFKKESELVPNGDSQKVILYTLLHVYSK